MSKTRYTVTLDDSAHDIITRIADAGNGSAYLSQVLPQRWRLCQVALSHLLGVGWTHAQVLDAVGLLNGVWEMALATGARHVVNGHLQQSKDARVQNAADGSDVPALLVVASEYWAGNDVLRAQLASGGGKKKRKAAAA